MKSRHCNFPRVLVTALGFLAVLSVLTQANDDDDDTEGAEFSIVTCGSAIKLDHITTSKRLHSHPIMLGSGSKQQSVTAGDFKDDPNSLWKVTGAHGSPCTAGTPVKSGQVVKLTHLKTKKNLHSHLFTASLSKQQEVSGYGAEGKGDTGDNWIVEPQEPEQNAYWMRGKGVRFKHADTGRYLRTQQKFAYNSQNCGQNCPIGGQLEVHAYPQHDDPNNWWQTADACDEQLRVTVV